MSRLLRRALMLGVAGFALVNVAALWPLTLGGDFLPIRAAALAVEHGRSVYGDAGFVYPPTAAVLAVPAAWASQSVAFAVWMVGSLLALGVAVLLVGSAAPRHRTVFGALAGMLCFGGCVATDSLSLGNASVLLVPVGVAAVLAFRRERWLLGCALVVGSMLFKPLLVPLLVVPAVRRQWRALLGSLGAGLVILLLTTAALGGAGSFLHVIVYCLRATNLHGGLAVNNVSVRGFAEAHGWQSAVTLSAVGSLAVLTLGALRRLPARRDGAARMAALAFGTTLLAGSISQTHYLLTLGALVITVLAAEPTRRDVALLSPGLALLLAPASIRDAVVHSSAAGRQGWYVLAELLLWVGLAFPAARAEPASAPGRAAQLVGVAG